MAGKVRGGYPSPKVPSKITLLLTSVDYREITFIGSTEPIISVSTKNVIFFRQFSVQILVSRSSCHLFSFLVQDLVVSSVE